MSRPYLSIIVPVFNTAKYLDRCIMSILQQEYQEFELILVDDGSSDTSPDICDRYAQQDARIHVIHKKNGGVMSARKKGIAHSCGSYISFIDSDDWIGPAFYNVFAQCQGSGYDVILMEGYHSDGAKSKRVRTRLRQGSYCKQEIHQMLARGMIPSLGLKIFKRELLEANRSLIDDRVWRGEDMLFSYACLLDADAILVKSSYQYHYVQHGASAMHRYSSRNIENLRYFALNAKRIQKLKGSSFLNDVWDRHILTELLGIINNEFYDKGHLLSPTEWRRLDKKFSRIRLPLLLSEDGIEKINDNRKWIYRLYSVRAFTILNLYLKYEDGYTRQHKRISSIR